MTLKEIKAAVKAGKVVHWANSRYTVGCVLTGGVHECWFIACDGGSTIGLTWVDGVTLNGKPEEFFIG